MRRALAGAAAGLAGTLAVSAVGRGGRRLLGGAPPFAPERIARRLTGARGRRARRLGALLRWTYGPLWGAGYALARRRRGHPLALAFALWLFERTLFPAVGATPPRRRWRRGSDALALAQTLAFAAATEAALVSLVAGDRPGGRRSRGSTGSPPP